MPDWDADSPRLRQNLAAVLSDIEAASFVRAIPTTGLARQWQRRTMAGLGVPRREFVGRFRGEPGLEQIEVAVGGMPGVPSGLVDAALATFERRLQAATADLDALVVAGDLPATADVVDAVIETAAWAHADWVRIHPFANGNGRTARLWANWVLMRYGIPPLIRLRPRPDVPYTAAGAAAMTGDHLPTFALFRRLVASAVAP